MDLVSTLLEAKVILGLYFSRGDFLQGELSTKLMVSGGGLGVEVDMIPLCEAVDGLGPAGLLLCNEINLHFGSDCGRSTCDVLNGDLFVFSTNSVKL
jgi:hypothetical protein